MYIPNLKTKFAIAFKFKLLTICALPSGTQKKNTTILLGGCSFSTNQITQRETLLNNLEYLPEKPKDRIAYVAIYLPSKKLMSHYSCFTCVTCEVSVNCNAKSVIKKPQRINFLRLLLSRWRIDKKTKPTGWDLDWGLDDDSMLLIGVYEHGLGSWDKVIADTKLNLAEKVRAAGRMGVLIS